MRGDVTFLEGQLRASLMQREALQRRKCVWHLIFCTDFTSSVPLGSQSGTSLPRRSLSSPLRIYYTRLDCEKPRNSGKIANQAVSHLGISPVKRYNNNPTRLKPYEGL